MYYRTSTDRSLEEAANQIVFGEFGLCVCVGGGGIYFGQCFYDGHFCCNLLMVIIILFILEWELL